MKTNGVRSLGWSEEAIKALEEQMEKTSPIGMYARPENIADMVAFLASEDSAFITGSNILIDGGVLWSNFDVKE